MKVELSKAELEYLMKIITKDVADEPPNNASWLLAGDLRDHLYRCWEE